MKKKSIAIACLIGLVSFLIYSCAKKESATPNSTIVPTDLLEAAKTWHAIKTNGTSTLSINSNPFTLQPLWKEAKLITLDKAKSLIIVSSPSFSFDSQSSKSGSRKFVFTVQGGQIVDGEIVETIGKSDYMGAHQDIVDNLSSGNTSGFTGSVIMYDLNYKWINSSVFVNGKKLSAPTTAMIGADNGQHKVNNKGNNIVTLGQCYAYYEVTTYTDGSEDWEYLFTACDNSGYGDAGGGGGGGTGTSPSGVPTAIFGLNNSNAQISDSNFDAFLDYAASQGLQVSDPFFTSVTVAGVSYLGEITQITDSTGKVIASYFSPDATTNTFTLGFEYNIGDGKGDPTPPQYLTDLGYNYFGNYPVPYTPRGGISNPAASIITDALTHDFPCATTLILNKLALNSQYQTFSTPFNTNRKPDLTWNDAPLPWNVLIPGTTNYTYQLGQTGYAGRSAFITLNTTMLQNSSQLYIASAAIHETLHAYINYNIETAVGGFLPPMNYNNNGTWFYSIEVWATLHGLPSNFSNHYLMLSSYFTTAVSILAAWDNNAHTNKQYAMAMLFGLNNGTDGTPAQQTLLQTEFNSLMTQYGITAADLTTYNQQNLTVTTGKLPTSGC